MPDASPGLKKIRGSTIDKGGNPWVIDAGIYKLNKMRREAKGKEDLDEERTIDSIKCVCHI